MKENSTGSEVITADFIKEKLEVKERKVKLVERETLMFPELWSHIYVVGSEPYQFPALFARAKCWQAKKLEDADIVLFTGGIADVSPALYGETRHLATMSDVDEDMRDILVFQEAAALGIPMVGVCRGAQFGHVMNGGKLYQHVDGHNKAHEIFVRNNRHYITNVSSVHHQMCMPNEKGGMEVIAEAYESTGKWSNEKTYQSGHTDYDIEAFFYPDTCFLGVQGHPEYSGFDEYTLFFMELIEQYICTNPEIKVVKGKNRVPDDVIASRKWRMPDTVNKFIKEHN